MTGHFAAVIGLLFLAVSFFSSLPAMFSAAFTPTPTIERCADATDLVMVEPPPNQYGKDYPPIHLHVECWSGWITTPWHNWHCTWKDKIVPEIQLPDGRRFPDTAKVEIGDRQSFRVRGVGLYICTTYP